ncbi:MAG: hypothetical protein V4439_01380 [Patescibacteria group bacterium]
MKNLFFLAFVFFFSFSAQAQKTKKVVSNHVYVGGGASMYIFNSSKYEKFKMIVDSLKISDKAYSMALDSMNFYKKEVDWFIAKVEAFEKQKESQQVPAVAIQKKDTSEETLEGFGDCFPPR